MKTHTTINGREFDFEHHPAAPAIAVIRESAGLTGTKFSCGAGVCGACTVLVDGAPCVTCLMPARALRERDVTTIEHFDADNLHPVQRAFLVHDGLQCGFCTPGFIMEAIAFYERRRAEFGTAEPTRSEIAAAMAGHLCRCGAYVGIYEAIRSAIVGDFDNYTSLEHARRDGLEKVTGSAQYTVDVQLPGMLDAALLGSPHANARVVSVNTARAEAMDGVKAVVDVLSDSHRVARYVGCPIVAVAAVDRATAKRAIDAIDVTYEVRDFVVDADQAMRAGAPVVYPEPKKSPPNASEGPIPPGSWDHNVRTPILNRALSKSKGTAQRALAAVRRGQKGLHLIEATYQSPAQSHAAFEPHACVAHWESAERLTVYASTQSIAHLHQLIVKAWNLKPDNVTVLSPYVGGAFGAKQGMLLENSAAIALARKAGAPVKLVFSRRDELVHGGCRASVKNEIALVVDDHGSPRGLTSRAYGNTGIAVQSQVVGWQRFTYKGPKDCEDFDVTTNSGPVKPMRAPSGPAAFFALESAVDEAAHRLRMDPVSLRRKWDDSDVRESLYDWIDSIPEWRARHEPGHDTGRFQSGIGFAIGNWFTVYSNSTRVQIDTSPEGGLVVSCAVQDMGQGARSVLAKAVADALGIPISQVNTSIGHSGHVKGPTASASRVTASIYPCALEAADMLRTRLTGAAVAQLQVTAAVWTDGGVRHARGFLPLPELLAVLPSISVTSKRRGANGPLDLLGMAPSGEPDASLFPRMTGSVCLMSVRVDTRLGRVHPEKVWVGMSVGRIVNPVLADSQIYGAVIQSLGLSITEERQYDNTTGTLLSSGMEEYRIPGMGEVPLVETFFDQSRFSGMKGGACGLSELATLAIPPALGNAVFNATGWRPTIYPLTPDRVLGRV